ncbi:Dus domain containing protein [Asbolus verrucosus]|uniref:Dus domain containing protein n=1 Tax=Asbolus verrucosus TaxID=1661398 RepID=A0A482VET1_ASBVE|nr:Dus domain containing protein [Asbolus verrucosus]
MTTKVNTELSYDNKIILAPMVRVCTLPMRLLALDYGADIVYTEELIDWKFLKCIRRENDVLGTIDYLDKSDGSVVFRTCHKEKNKVIVQLGTCDTQRALKYSSGGSKEIEVYEDIIKFKNECGCSSVMIARAAEGNCSIFRQRGLLDLEDVIVDYLKYAVDYDNSPSNTKYCIQNMLKELQETSRGKKFLECQTLEQIWY